MTAWPELSGPPEDAARRLLGAVLRVGPVAVRLTEVEAYGGDDDPGSHACGRRTPRTEVMYGPAGRLYCYLSYGMHVCANVVCGPDGTAGAVLLRAGRVVEGLEEARGRRPGVVDERLARGPALLTRALGISLDDGGSDLARGPVRLELGREEPAAEAGPRVGLRLASERPWRFRIAGDPTVSAYRRHAHAV